MILLTGAILSLFLGTSASTYDQKYLKNKNVETQGEKKTNPFNHEFVKYVHETLEDWHVPGVAIGVVDEDEIFTKGFGIAEFPDKPVTPDTLFYVGSTTKAFTATAMALIIQNSSSTIYSNVNWETPISQLIRDDFVLPDEQATARVTIEDALSHRTGMGRHDYSYGGLYSDRKGGLRKGAPVDVVRSMRWLPMFAEMRTKWHYCNMMFTTIGYLIEKLTGVWLGDFLKLHIWDPLEMDSTYFSLSDAQRSPNQLAQGYVYNKKKNNYSAVRFGDLSVPSGAGGIISSVTDFTKWIHSLIYIKYPFTAPTHSALLTPRMLLPTTLPYTGLSAYGFGWIIRNYHGYEIYEHDGGMEAYGTLVLFIPVLKFGLVAMSNTAVTSNHVCTETVFRLVDEKLQLKSSERFDWNKRNHQTDDDNLKDYENATNKYYPFLPTPPLPASLPLKNYAGTYFHPAYRNNTVVLKGEETLYINRTDITFSTEIELKHISGDYFMAYVDSSAARGSIFRSALPAEFKVGSDGTSTTLGLGMEEGEGKVWFERIE